MKEKLEKKYKAYRWARLISLVFSCLFCVIPIIISSVNAVSKIKTPEKAWALGGVSAFVLAIVLLIVFRSFVGKFASKLPCTLTALASVGVVLLTFVCLKKIIDEAIKMLVFGLIGIAIGFILELASMYFKSMAEETKEQYRGLNNNV